MNASKTMSPFYSEADIDELTGIRRGSNGLNKYQMQVRFLRKAGVSFIENARGRPVVAVSAIEGRKASAMPTVQQQGWQPKVLTA